jgi:hypothetical protein
MEFSKKADYTLEMMMMPLATTEKVQSVTVLFNGTELDSFELENEFKKYSVQLPSSLIKDDGYNILEFNYSQLLSPAELGMSGDTRKLAVYFDFIKTITE